MTERINKNYWLERWKQYRCWLLPNCSMFDNCAVCQYRHDNNIIRAGEKGAIA